jgi:hypothetical protein
MSNSSIQSIIAAAVHRLRKRWPEISGWREWQQQSEIWRLADDAVPGPASEVLEIAKNALELVGRRCPALGTDEEDTPLNHIRANLHLKVFAELYVELERLRRSHSAFGAASGSGSPIIPL